MDYILIPTESLSERDFFLDLLKKMQKKASILSGEEMEDALLLSAMQAAGNEKGSLDEAKAHLMKVASGK